MANRWSATRFRLQGAVVLVVALLAACSSSRSGASAPSTPATSPPPPTGATDQIYVSLGDSYAAGVQPSGPHQGSTTRNGFAYQVVDAAKRKGYDLRLTNFGCGGATTDSLLTSPGCSPPASC